MKIFSKFPYSQDIHDVNEFVSSLGQLWRNFALLYSLTNGSSGVNGCRQNESKQQFELSF